MATVLPLSIASSCLRSSSVCAPAFQAWGIFSDAASS